MGAGDGMMPPEIEMLDPKLVDALWWVLRPKLMLICIFSRSLIETKNVVVQGLFVAVHAVPQIFVSLLFSSRIQFQSNPAEGDLFLSKYRISRISLSSEG